MQEKSIKTCCICGRTSEEKRIVLSHKFNDKYYCMKHYFQLRNHGNITDPSDRTQKDSNEIIEYEDCIKIALYDIKNNVIGYAIANKEFKTLLSKYKWHMTPKGYARTDIHIPSTRKKGIFMHRLIMEFIGHTIKDGEVIDHINRDPLDNRKDNLRIVSLSINAQNSKPYKNKLLDLPKGIKYSYQASMKIKQNKRIEFEYKTLSEAAYCRLLLEKIFYDPISYENDRPSLVAHIDQLSDIEKKRIEKQIEDYLNKRPKLKPLRYEAIAA